MEDEILETENEQLQQQPEQELPAYSDKEPDPQTPQDSPRTYTQAEVDAIVGKSKARASARAKKEYERKYGDLLHVLRSGTGMDDVEQITKSFNDYYTGQGMEIPAHRSDYSGDDLQILARADADEIIRGGYEDVVEETDRLSGLGVQNMSPREKAMFTALADYRKTEERNRELAKLGVSKEVYESPEFREFMAMFRGDIPAQKVYELYTGQAKPNTEPIGSMKNTAGDGEKTFYTPDEVDRLSDKDLEDPKVMQAVRKSMLRWK